MCEAGTTYPTTIYAVFLFGGFIAIVSDAQDWEARFETVKNTFSSRVGQISNAALNRSILAYAFQHLLSENQRGLDIEV